MLHRLLQGRIVVTPRRTEEDGLMVDFAGRATYARLGRQETTTLSGTLPVSPPVVTG